MFRPTSRTFLRTAERSWTAGRTVSGRRFLTTEPPHLRSRSWKSSAARWGIAIAGIYFYNTSSVFAEEPAFNPPKLVDIEAEDTTSHPSLETIAQQERAKRRQDAVLKSATGATPAEDGAPSTSTDPESADLSTSPEELEEEASSQGAFNPETGEINWDCPCLGGMATGPCGEQFKAAFSCFVYSTEEPKGMDCIDNFKIMQDCFREHPEVYKGELADDDDEDGVMDQGLAEERAELEKEVEERRKAVQEKQSQSETPQKRLLEESPAPAPQTKPKKSSKASSPSSKPESEPSVSKDAAEHEQSGATGKDAPSQLTRKPAPTTAQDKTSDPKLEKFDEDLELMPKEWHDGREAKASSGEAKDRS